MSEKNIHAMISKSKVNKEKQVPDENTFFQKVKREAGVNPARTRRCMDGVLFYKCHWQMLGRRNKMWMSKSEDLPVLCCGTTRNWLNHTDKGNILHV